MSQSFQSAPFATTLPYFSERTFKARASYLYASRNTEAGGRPAFEMRNLVSVLAAAARHDILVLDSLHKSSLLACVVLALVPRRAKARIILCGEMWAPDSGLLGWVERAAIAVADRSIDRYIVISSEEVDAFPRNWGLDKSKTTFLPFFWTLKDCEIAPKSVAGDYVFAGGNSHRNYESLIEAAGQMPDVRFVVATKLLQNRKDLPCNVEARPVPHAEFVSLLKGARAVVVPLRSNLGRSAGQQTYLNAMLLGKPTIVSEAFGVSDYILSGGNGWIVEGTGPSYEGVLRHVLAAQNAGEVEDVCRAARETATRFTFDRHAQGIVAVVDDVASMPREPKGWAWRAVTRGAD